MAEVSIKVAQGDAVEDGQVINIWTEEDIETTWAWKLITGLHYLPGVPFDAKIYNKYFTRFLVDRKTSRRRRMEIEKPDCNFRDANARINIKQKSLYRYIDYQNVKFLKPLQREIREDVRQAFGWVNVRHSFSDKVLTEIWPWGRMDVKLFLLGYVPDNEFNGRLDAKKVISRGKDVCRVDYRGVFRGDLGLNDTIAEHLRGRAKAEEYVRGNLREVAALDRRQGESLRIQDMMDVSIQQTMDKSKMLDLLDDREVDLPVRFWVKMDKHMFDNGKGNTTEKR